MNAPDTIALRIASNADSPAILALLAASSLPIGDLGDGLPGTFLVAESAGQVVGTVGLETLGNDGLLRSLAVADTWRNRGLGKRLVNECEALARRAALGQLYLLTTTAADYFQKRGFSVIDRQGVPAPVASHAQFRSLCPASARCLGKALNG